MWVERWRDMIAEVKPARVLLVGKMWDGIELPGGEIVNLESNTIKDKEAARDAGKQSGTRPV